MAIFDLLTTFADKVTSPTATGVAQFGNTVDTQVARDIGQGHPVYLIVMVSEAFTSGTSAATVDFQFRTSTNDTISGTDTIKVSTGPVAVNDLVLDYYYVVTLPAGLADYDQYIGMSVDVGGEALTAGGASAFLSLDPIGWKAQAEGQN